MRYQGYEKHKADPRAFGLLPFNGDPGDATLCDEHAQFLPSDLTRVPRLIDRGLRAGLIGIGLRVFWTIDDNGWIYEARVTNAGQSVFHGYPVRPTEAISEGVFRRFDRWAQDEGGASDRQAAQNCRSFYGIRG